MVLQIEPDHIECLLARGNAYSKKGLLQKAINDLSKVLTLDPENVSASFARAACYNSLGEFFNAIEDYNSALTKDQSCSSAYRNSNKSLDISRRSRWYLNLIFISSITRYTSFLLH